MQPTVAVASTTTPVAVSKPYGLRELAPVQWEYMVIEIPPAPYKPSLREEPINGTDMLNAWGAAGWELVQIVGYAAYMKRKVVRGGGTVL